MGLGPGFKDSRWGQKGREGQSVYQLKATFKTLSQETSLSPCCMLTHGTGQQWLAFFIGLFFLYVPKNLEWF